MDISEVLEKMALNVFDDDTIDLEPSEEEIQRWMRLFKYPYADAREKIKSQKSDFSRHRVSEEHWELVRVEKEAQGYSREAPNFCRIMINKASRSAISHDERGCIGPLDQTKSRARCCSYLILLEGILSTPESIQSAANLPSPPRTHHAKSDTGSDALFCTVDSVTKHALESWLSGHKSSLKPTFVRDTRAKKDLDPYSIYPTLGQESTLPQHRFSTAVHAGRNIDSNLPQHRRDSSSGTLAPTHPVQQDDYPVWYFFYGTLACPSFLANLLSLPPTQNPPRLIPARISGGALTTWGDKYKALVDGERTDRVDGSAFRVASRDHEDALLRYETEAYEVVRCCIISLVGEGERRIQGLTFRFVGPG